MIPRLGHRVRHYLKLPLFLATRLKLLGKVPIFVYYKLQQFKFLQKYHRLCEIIIMNVTGRQNAQLRVLQVICDNIFLLNEWLQQ